MSELTAKIVAVDDSKLGPANTPDWNGTSEVSYIVEIDDGKNLYQRKLTFVLHDHKINHIGSQITKEDVERAILAEVDQITSIRNVCEELKKEIGICQIEKLQNSDELK